MVKSVFFVCWLGLNVVLWLNMCFCVVDGVEQVCVWLNMCFFLCFFTVCTVLFVIKCVCVLCVGWR